MCSFRPAVPTPCPGSRGVTLAEFVVTIAMIGIVLAATLPPFRALLEGNRHRGSVSQVTSRMYLVRQLAVRDRQEWVMVVDPVNARFWSFQDTNANGVQNAGERQLGPWSLDIGVSLQNLDWPANQMTFFPDGTTSQTGDVRVFDASGRTSTIRVSSLTGNVDVLP